jgi:hypothetical protein
MTLSSIIASSSYPGMMVQVVRLVVCLCLTSFIEKIGIQESKKKSFGRKKVIQ